MAKKWLVVLTDYTIILYTEKGEKLPAHARLIGAIRGGIDIYAVGKIGERHQAIINVIVNKCQELYIPLSSVAFLWRNAPKTPKIEKTQLKMWED
jgi:hypothetical protein